jgi:hypothetical protein
MLPLITHSVKETTAHFAFHVQMLTDFVTVEDVGYRMLDEIGVAELWYGGEAMTQEALNNILKLVEGSDELEDAHALQILLQSIKTLAEKGLGRSNWRSAMTRLCRFLSWQRVCASSNASQHASLSCVWAIENGCQRRRLMFPNHARFPKEMAVIGRLLVDYGELEVDLMNCVQVMRDYDLNTSSQCFGSEARQIGLILPMLSGVSPTLR